MRQIKEILRLKWEVGLSDRQVARSAGLSRPTVSKYFRRAKTCGLSWPLPASLDDAQLERMLFPAPPPASVARPEPDWPSVHRELKRKGVTLQICRYRHICRHADSRFMPTTRSNSLINHAIGQSLSA